MPKAIDIYELGRCSRVFVFGFSVKPVLGGFETKSLSRA
jgi:hypothetical protein